MEEVGKPSGLTRRKGSTSWYYRQRCPKRFIAAGIPAQVWISLETAIYAEALARLDDARAEASRRFTQPAPEPVRSGIYSRTIRPTWPADPTLPTLVADHAAPLARDFFHRALRSLDGEPPFPADEDAAAVAAYRAELEDRHARLTRGDRDGGVVAAQISVLHAAGLRALPEGEASILLASYLRRAIAQIAKLRLARFDGDYSTPISDSLFTSHDVANASNVMPTPAAAARRSEITVGGAAARYRRDVLALRVVTCKTSLKHLSLLKHVETFFDATTPLCDIARADCNRFRDTLAKLQPNFVKKGQSLAQAVEPRPDIPTLAWETQNHYLRMMDDLMAWALKERLVPDNPAEGITPLKKREAAEMQRLPFQARELELVFAAPIFTGCVDDGYGFSRPGPNIVRRSRYWLPLIALFSGLRMGEILQLTPNHVRISEGGHLFIVLTRDMKLKTDSAEREIPIHPMLERLGFVSWVRERERAGATDLFDDVPTSKHGYRSDFFTRRFATFLKRIDLPSDRREKLCFHSFRHTFKDALNAAGTPEGDMDELCGWSRGKTTGRRYGSGFSAARLKPYVDQVAYGVDLSHLTHFASEA